MNGYKLQFKCFECDSGPRVYEDYIDIPIDSKGEYICPNCEHINCFEVIIIHDNGERLNYYSSSLK